MELNNKIKALLFKGFYMQLKAIDFLKTLFFNSKSGVILIEGRFLENFFLLKSLNFSYFLIFLIKAIIPLGTILILTLLF